MNPSVSKSRRPLIVGIVSIVLLIIGYAGWTHLSKSHGHAHGHDDHGAAELALNNGQRWATDEPLRLGMLRIRDAVALRLNGGAGRDYPDAQAKVLNDTVQENVNSLIQNCKLEPAADANLHLLINELMTGAAMVSANPQSQEGIAKLAHALQEYPKYFDHPNWSPLPEPKF